MSDLDYDAIERDREFLASAPIHAAPFPAHPVGAWNAALGSTANDHIPALLKRCRELERALGDCFVAAGGDTDGDYPERLHASALHEVKDLRACYDEACDEVTQLERQNAALVELVEEGWREAYQTAFGNGLNGGHALGGGYSESDPDGAWNASDARTALRRITGEGE